jgi:hypothetical protein
MVAEALLASWRDTPTRRGIIDFVADVTSEGSTGFVAPGSRTGRRPLVAGGNSNGDIPMLRFARGSGRPALRLLVRHDDPEREFDYDAGAEEALQRAEEHSWVVVSVKDDWATVFPPT